MQEFILFVATHWLLFLGLLAILIALIKLELDESAIGIGPLALSPQQAVTLINHEQAVVLDMRSLQDYTKAHLLAAVSVPLDKLDSQLNSLKKYASKPLILYGIDGKNFELAKLKLAGKGLANVFHLRGGLEAWKAAGMPMAK